MPTAPATLPFLDMTMLAPWVVMMMNPAPNERPEAVTVEEANERSG
jgi:hypothetical protein